jgi:hypothetical protein
MEDLKKSTEDVEVYGDPDKWILICKVSSHKQGWMKSTKVYDLPTGCLVQVTTEIRRDYRDPLLWLALKP